MTADKPITDCNKLPGHMRDICLGTHVQANGRRHSEWERRKLVAMALRVPVSDVVLPEATENAEPTSRAASGIGDAIHAIIARDTGIEIPCSDCREAINRLNWLAAEEVLRQAEEIASTIVSNAKTYSGAWWVRWGARLAPGLAHAKAMSWIEEACRGKVPEPVKDQAVGLSREVSDVTIVVKSFCRHVSLWRFVVSAKRWYPNVPIIVCDDSFADTSLWTDALKEVSEMPGVTLVRLPYDSGLPAGRNAAVAAAKTSRIILCDDDFVVTEETRIENLLSILDTGYDIVGGVVRMDGARPENWTGRISYTGTAPNRTVHLTPLENAAIEVNGLHCQDTDITLNFFAAKTESLRRVPWDTRYKITDEHVDSFLEWNRAGFKIAWTKSCVIGHWQESPGHYRSLRNRGDTAGQLNSKWGLAARKMGRRHQVTGLPHRETVRMFGEAYTAMSNSPIVVLGVGRCGTTIATKMLMTLGWKCPMADEEFAEHVEMRAINDKIIRTGAIDQPRIMRVMSSMSPPWILKDPRLAMTLDNWKPHMANHKPTLLWISRDMTDVRRSMEAKGWGDSRDDGQLYLRGQSLESLEASCKAHFNNWPWGKVHLTFENLKAAVALFDVRRG